MEPVNDYIFYVMYKSITKRLCNPHNQKEGGNTGEKIQIRYVKQDSAESEPA